MNLDHEIDAIFKKLDQRITDPEVACAALKQIIKINFLTWANGPQIGDIHELVDTIFQNYIGLSNLRHRSTLKAKIHKMRADAHAQRQTATPARGETIAQNDRIKWLT